MPTSPARYRRVTVYLTEEQHRWSKRVAAFTVDNGPELSVSDVVRLALERLRVDGRDLREALIERAWTEATVYPGRASVGCHRGLLRNPRPPDCQPASPVHLPEGSSCSIPLAWGSQPGPESSFLLVPLGRWPSVSKTVSPDLSISRSGPPSQAELSPEECLSRPRWRFLES